MRNRPTKNPARKFMADNDVFRIYDERVERINELIQKGYNEESVILIVTIFEILLENVFKMSYGYWFHEETSQFTNLSPEEKINFRKKIRKYLEKVKKYDEYLSNLYLFQGIYTNPDIPCLYFTLFNGRSKINFQNLKDHYGAKEAYQKFLNIDISNGLDVDQKKSQTKWDLLCKLIDERHDIIHRGRKTTLKNTEIVEILDSINFLKEHILMNIINIHFNDFAKSVLDLNPKN